MTEILCPKCQHKNPKRAKMCRKCGANLVDQPTQVMVQDLQPDDVTNYPMLANTADDDQTMLHREDNGVSSTPVDTKNLHIPDDESTDSSNMGMAIMQGGLILLELKTHTKFYISADELREVLIGRVYQNTHYMPTVDLSGVDGQKQGVSRRHATLQKTGSLLQLIDHHSVNGTFLNGEKLVPEQSRIVRDKDVIRLGGVSLRVIYMNEAP
jgi:hypothetical protein